MQCLEVRRQLTIDPASREPALLAHLQQCPSCASFAQEQQAFDARLAEAVDTPVPEGLAARIVLNQSTRLRRRQRYRFGVGLAASVLLVAGVTGMLLLARISVPLEQTVLQHVHNEMDHLAERKDIRLPQLKQLLAEHGVSLDDGLGPVRYAGACQIRKSEGVHLVVEAGGKPVTVLLMPNESVEGRRTFGDERFSGVAVPLDNGSMAIIGEDPNAVKKVEQRLQQTLHFLS